MITSLILTGVAASLVTSIMVRTEIRYEEGIVASKEEVAVSLILLIVSVVELLSTANNLTFV